MPERLAALALTLCLLTGCAAPAAQPVSPPAEEPAALEPLSAESARPEHYASLPLYIDGLLCARAYECDGCAFLPVRALCDFFDLDMSQSADEESFLLRIGTLTVRGETVTPYYTAAGRYVWAPEGWLWFNDELYLPGAACEKLFHITVEQGEDRANVSGAGMRLLTGGTDFYELNFPSDDVYWLSHIISAEARFEPLEGQIGVGNVVLNRVESPDFPDSVFEVIYDTEHTIQFEPIALGGIREEPGEQAVIAAYLCLEGANTVADSLYFVNPAYGSGWFDAYLEQTAVIGNHNFYR